MTLFEDTNPRALKELLGDIHGRTTVLPDFQRDFVWDPGATQELIVSIANNYPAGSILRVRDTQRNFAVREFEGAPKLEAAHHTFLVLDGQQRLTSLYQAFFGVGDHRYFLDLRRLMSGADFEESVFHLRTTTRQARALEAFERQAADRVLPLAVLQGGAGGFAQWSRRTARLLPDTERIELEDKLDGIEQRWIQVIDDYHFPVVTLAESTSADALCTIFETLNRTGVKLSVFELLTARFWPSGINLRELWDGTRVAHQIISDFEVDPYYLLMAIALVSRKSPSCVRGDVLDLKGDDIRTLWEPVARGFANGLRILRDDCHVALPKWLPYPTMLVPLAATLARNEDTTHGPQAGAIREQLKRWFWCAVFGQAYESSTNTQSVRDFTELSAWASGGAEPASVRDVRFDPNSLRDVTPRQRAIYRGAMCLILGAQGGAQDFHTKALITGALMEQEGIDDHHIFPAAWLARAGVHQRQRDCVLNRTLIDRTTNQVISDHAPSTYLAQIRATAGFPFEAVMASHSLPVEGDSVLFHDDFDGFMAWRQARLWQSIQDVTGLRVASRLEEGS